jgi:hypothetical protein
LTRILNKLRFSLFSVEIMAKLSSSKLAVLNCSALSDRNFACCEWISSKMRGYAWNIDSIRVRPDTYQKNCQQLISDAVFLMVWNLDRNHFVRHFFKDRTEDTARHQGFAWIIVLSLFFAISRVIARLMSSSLVDSPRSFLKILFQRTILFYDSVSAIWIGATFWHILDNEFLWMRQNPIDPDGLLSNVLRCTSGTEHFLIHHGIWFDSIIFAGETTGINIDEI